MNGFVVGSQMIVAPEAFATFLTLMCFLTRVDLLMFGQMIVPYEGFSALVTLVAFVVMVNSEVEPVGAAVAETLSADAAQVRLLAAVDPQVLFECCPLPH